MAREIKSIQVQFADGLENECLKGTSRISKHAEKTILSANLKISRKMYADSAKLFINPFGFRDPLVPNRCVVHLTVDLLLPNFTGEILSDGSHEFHYTRIYSERMLMMEYKSDIEAKLASSVEIATVAALLPIMKALSRVSNIEG